MKKHIYKTIAVIVLFVSILSINCSAEGDSTVKENYRTDLQMFYLKNGAVKSFTTTLNMVRDGNSRPNKNAVVKLFGGENKDQLLGEITIGERGKMVFNLKANTVLSKDKDGFYTVTATYDGNDSINPGEAQVKFQDFNISMVLHAQDSTKTVVVNCYTLNDKGEKIPAKEVPINFYVSRMFSNLKVGDATTDENGDCTFDFPLDIVGDSVGNLNILTRIDEHELYGNVQVSQESRWGVPTMHKIPIGYRALWTQVAPTWMVITLIILLSGVWGHYAFAVYRMSRLPKQAKPEGNQQT
jgi:hypothetical protein